MRKPHADNIARGGRKKALQLPRITMLCLLLAGSSICGCSSAPNSDLATITLPSNKSLQAAGRGNDADARLPFDKIQPALSLSPTTHPAADDPAATRPAPAALQLYAQARAAQIEHQRPQAIDLLQEAIRFDPYSYDLYAMLGTLYFEQGDNPHALSAFEKAAALEPDHLYLQLDLGRACLEMDDARGALTHLRLATMTGDYSQRSDVAAVVDFFLARALQESGYARAALDRYTLLFQRFKQVQAASADPEYVNLVQHPEIIYAQIGELYHEYGDDADASKAYGLAARHDPENFELRRREVRCALAAGQRSEARSAVSSLVVQFQASTESIDFLKEIYHRLDNDHQARAALLGCLNEELARKPQPHGDHLSPVENLIQALFELDDSSGDHASAIRLLDEIRSTATDSDLLYFLARLYRRANQLQTTEDVLRQVVKLNPHDAPASNDLGYLQARSGCDLAAAESLVRRAVEAEPYNPTYLDSLGWVSYMRGNFLQAKVYLDRAISASEQADPVTLDHLGDVLYRLSQPDSAVDAWNQSLQRLNAVQGRAATARNVQDPSDPDTPRNLRMQLRRKIDEQRSGRRVELPPTGAEMLDSSNNGNPAAPPPNS